ncbi:MAG: hypothetical protein LBF37_01955 [Rickettsiales bacterium]|nr:hypothetical protein [Rickettsiales bacterium]
MLTKIDLCAHALLKLGESPIQSLNDNTASAQLARTLFGPVIEALIASQPWKFATRRFDLNKTTDGDFLIPSDVLRVLNCKGQVMGNRIVSAADNISITALVRTSPENFPSYFVSLAATKLAMEFCAPLVADQTVFRMLVALYESELKSAKFIDSTISVNSDIAEFSLINFRY